VAFSLTIVAGTETTRFIGLLVMLNRPTSITILSWLSIVCGVCGFLLNLYGLDMVDSSWRIHLYPRFWYSDMHPLAMWLVPGQWIVLAACGMYMLFGFKWARWMLVAWVGYHTFQSIAHTRFELAFEVLYDLHTPWESLAHMHLYIAILLIVFTPSAHRYFRGASGGLTASAASSRNHIFSNRPGASSTAAEPTDPVAALK